MSMHDPSNEPKFQPGGPFLGTSLFSKVMLIVMGLLLFVGLQMVLFSKPLKPQDAAPASKAAQKPAPPRKPDMFPGKQTPNNPKLGRQCIRGRVLRADGQPAANILVTADERSFTPERLFDPIPANRWSARTGADGVFVIEGLKPRGYVVAAVTLNSHALAAVTVTEDGPIPEPVLTLVASQQAQVLPVNAAGAPVTRQVKVYPLESTATLSSGSNPYQYLPQTQSVKGAFHFAHLPADSWRFLVVAPGFAPVLTEKAPLDGVPVLVTLAASATIKGQVLTATGKPVSRVKIQAVERSFKAERYEATADNFGRFTFDTLRPATYALRLCSKQAAFQSPLEIVEAVPGSSEERLFHAVPAARMRGRAILADNRGYVANAYVTVRLAATPDFSCTAKTDSAGFYTIYGLPAGDYAMNITLPPGLTFSGPPPATVSVQLPGPIAGPEIIAVEMPPLSGVVYDASEIPIADANVYAALEGASEPVVACHTDLSGAFTCRAAAPGATITLWAEKSGLETSRLGPILISPEGEKDLKPHFPPNK